MSCFYNHKILPALGIQISFKNSNPLTTFQNFCRHTCRARHSWQPSLFDLISAQVLAPFHWWSWNCYGQAIWVPPPRKNVCRFVRIFRFHSFRHCGWWSKHHSRISIFSIGPKLFWFVHGYSQSVNTGFGRERFPLHLWPSVANLGNTLDFLGPIKIA